MGFPPEHFTPSFAPGDNTFGITINKIFPPPEADPRLRKGYLIKVTILLRMAPEMELWEFNALVGAIIQSKLFCGIWAADVSDVTLDDEGATAEVVCYLQQGQEQKLVHLDAVVAASPQLRRATAYPAQDGDRMLVADFVRQVKGGADLATAMQGALQKARAGGYLAGIETDARYVIGKGGGKTVVLEGEVAKRLLDADRASDKPPPKRRR